MKKSSWYNNIAFCWNLTGFLCDGHSWWSFKSSPVNSQMNGPVCWLTFTALNLINSSTNAQVRNYTNLSREKTEDQSVLKSNGTSENHKPTKFWVALTWKVIFTEGIQKREFHEKMTSHTKTFYMWGWYRGDNESYKLKCIPELVN